MNERPAYELKYIEAYEKYISGEEPKTYTDGKKELQKIKATVSIVQGNKRIGIVAENINTNEIFYIPQNELNELIKEDGYYENIYLRAGVMFIKQIERIQGTVCFPYTTMLIKID